MKSTALKLTADRCHAAHGFLSRVPMFEGLPLSTCAAGSDWFGFGWRGVGDGSPPDDVVVLDAYTD